MKNKECKLRKKLESDAKITIEETKVIANIVRQEINFMIRNSIMMTPINYEKWFYLFCHTIQTHQNLNDLEMIGLFKEIYDDHIDEVKYEHGHRRDETPEQSKNVSKALSKIASEVDQNLLKIMDTLFKHNDSIDVHTESVIENSKDIQHDAISASLQKILSELGELKQENKNLSAQLQSYHHNIKSLTEELQVAKTEAEVDFLTGLLNRRRFERAATILIEDLKSKNYPFAVVMLDIDHFKQVNDEYGHPVGDEVLQEIATVLKTFLRANAIPGRIGGEEFAIILPGSELDEARRIAERLRYAIENRSFSHELRVTASFGVTEAKKIDTIDTVFKRVDKALYDAKKAGRNMVIASE